MTHNVEMMEKFYDLMLEVRDVTGKLDKRIGSIEEKFDMIKGDIVDRVTACSVTKQEQIESLKNRILVLESRIEFIVRTVLVAVIGSVLYGGYIITK